MPWAPDYITTADLAEYCEADPSADQADLARAAAGASRAIDRNTNRQFGQVAAPEAREYTPRWSKSRGTWLVPIDDLMTVTGLVVTVDTAKDGTYATTLPAAEFVKRPRNAAAKGRPWEEIMILRGAVATPIGFDGEVRVVAQFGWTGISLTIELACRLQASRFFIRREAPFGIAGSPATGSEMRLLAKVDPDVAVALDDYRRKVWAR